MDINHHIKYKELHGEDVVIRMSQSEHKKLHAKLRKEGKCNVPAKELHKISTAGYNRAHTRSKHLHQFTPDEHAEVRTVLNLNQKTGGWSVGTFFINRGGA